MIVTEQIGDSFTVPEAVAGALDGKEDQLVELSAGGLLQLATTGVVIGTYQGKLGTGVATGSGNKMCRVRRIGGGTIRMIQEAAIPVGTRVQQGTAPEKVKARAASGLNFGVKIAPRSNGAAGDVIEVLPRIEVS